MFAALFILIMSSCFDKSANTEAVYPPTPLEAWKDSIAKTTQHLSFDGVTLGDTLKGCGNKGREDMLSIDWLDDLENKVEKENNIYRSIRTFNGVVWSIIVTMDNGVVFNDIVETYFKRYNYPDSTVNTYSGDGFSMDFNFRNSSLSVSRGSGNEYIDKYGQIAYHDMRFREDEIYSIVLEDKKIKQIVEKKEKAREDSIKKVEEEQQQRRYEEIQRKEDSLRVANKKRY